MRFFGVVGVVASLLPFTGCGSDSSSDSGPSTNTGTAVVQATDASFQDLSSLEMTVTSIDVIDTAGAAVRVFTPASNPGATTTLDLASLDSRQPVIAVSDLPTNPFSVAQIACDVVTATDDSGTARTA